MDDAGEVADDISIEVASWGYIGAGSCDDAGAGGDDPESSSGCDDVVGLYGTVYRVLPLRCEKVCRACCFTLSFAACLCVSFIWFILAEGVGGPSCSSM